SPALANDSAAPGGPESPAPRVSANESVTWPVQVQAAGRAILLSGSCVTTCFSPDCYKLRCRASRLSSRRVQLVNESGTRARGCSIRQSVVGDQQGPRDARN